ncbi:MAG: hypothetical protein GF308_21920 [Candidatus Heimdallarchaeota archaeon]|nr:hypothetical protein [Candidatus Heimdallarchaeota archaeon]
MTSDKLLEQIEKAVVGTITLPIEETIAALRNQAKKLQGYFETQPSKTEKEANSILKTFVVLFLGCYYLLQDIGVYEELVPVAFVCPTFAQPNWLKEMKECLLLGVDLFDAFVERKSAVIRQRIIKNPFCDWRKKALNQFVKRQLRKNSTKLKIKQQQKEDYYFSCHKNQKFAVDLTLIPHYLSTKFDLYKRKMALKGVIIP